MLVLNVANSRVFQNFHEDVALSALFAAFSDMQTLCPPIVHIGYVFYELCWCPRPFPCVYCVTLIPCSTCVRRSFSGRHQTLSGFHKRAVTTLSFSPDGRHLASVGCDDDHSIAVYDWKNRLLRVRASRGQGKDIDQISYSP